MAKGINKAIVIGNVGKDPEVTQTNNGKALAKFSLAVTEYNGTTLWLNITAWGKTAEFVGEYVKKGSQLYVEGRISEDRWEKDGQTRTKMYITADSVQLLSSRNRDEQPRPPANDQIGF